MITTAIRTCFICMLLLVALFAFSGKSVRAQSAINDNDVSVNVTPDIPAAFDDTTFELVSYTVDLDRATITWSVNGKVALSGTGIKKFSQQAGDIGTTTRIDVSIVTSDLLTLNKTVLLQPADVDVFWESADGYAPPFYQGRILPSMESSIKVVALPWVKDSSGKTLQFSDFVYKWKRNDNAQPDNSGYNKNSFIFTSSYLNQEEDIELNAGGVSENYSAKKDVVIHSFSPKILFYENDPLRGILYGKSLDSSFVVDGAEKSIIAEPYFFSAESARAFPLTYEWKVNDGIIDTPAVKNILSIQAGSVKGAVSIALSIENISKLFQDATGSLNFNLQ